MRRTAAALLAVAASLAATPPPATAAQVTPPTLTLAAQPAEVAFGDATVLGGVLATATGAPIAGEAVELQASRYPFRGFRDTGHGVTGPDGSYSFAGVKPDRNTRYRVADLGAAGVISAAVPVYVDARAVQHVYRRGSGQAQVTVIAYHGASLDWGRLRVYWFAAPFGSRGLALVAVTHSRELRPGVTFMSATFDAPARHFAYRACFDPPLERAYGPPPHHRCPTRDFTLPRRRHG